MRGVVVLVVLFTAACAPRARVVVLTECDVLLISDCVARAETADARRACVERVLDSRPRRLTGR